MPRRKTALVEPNVEIAEEIKSAESAPLTISEPKVETSSTSTNSPELFTQIGNYFNQQNLQTLTKTVLVNPLFSLFVITTVLDGPLQDMALWAFIAICLFNNGFKLEN